MFPIKSIIPNKSKNEQFNFFIDKLLRNNKIGYILKQANFNREQYISCVKIMKFIFGMYTCFHY